MLPCYTDSTVKCNQQMLVGNHCNNPRKQFHVKIVQGESVCAVQLPLMLALDVRLWVMRFEHMTKTFPNLVHSFNWIINHLWLIQKKLQEKCVLD